MADQVQVKTIKSRSYETLNSVAKWKMRPPLLNYLDSIGMGWIRKFSRAQEFKLDLTLVNKLVAKYDKEGYFKLGNTKVYFGLVEVAVIYGLKIHGEPVMGDIESNYVNVVNDAFDQALYEKWMNKPFKGNPLGNKKKRAKIKLTWLRKNYGRLNISPEHELWLPYLKAFFLHLIGNFIVPDSDTTVVSYEYLSLMKDMKAMEAMGSYAWGAAAWASMSVALRGGYIHGLAYALVIFCVENIKPLRDLLAGPGVVPPMELPLLFSWSKLLDKKLKGHTKNLASKYDDILNNFIPSYLIVDPYKRLNLGKELELACSVSICINFKKVAHHRPDYCCTQYGFQPFENDIVPDPHPRLPTMKPFTIMGPKKKNLNADTDFEEYKANWNSRVPLSRNSLSTDWNQPWLASAHTINATPPPLHFANEVNNDELRVEMNQVSDMNDYVPAARSLASAQVTPHVVASASSSAAQLQPPSPHVEASASSAAAQSQPSSPDDGFFPSLQLSRSPSPSASPSQSASPSHSAQRSSASQPSSPSLNMPLADMFSGALQTKKRRAVEKDISWDKRLRDPSLRRPRDCYSPSAIKKKRVSKKKKNNGM